MDTNNTYDNIKGKIEKNMKFDNDTDYIIDLVLATALSMYLERPIWLMLIAPPSSGKTEIMKIISKLDDYHVLSNLTNRALFSGHTMAQGGYMQREVGNRGILCFPDFTTVTSLPANIRNEIFNQLRVIYDGKSSLKTGIDTGATKEWEGKVAVLASVTESIEKIREKNTDLGERFLYYNFVPTIDDDTLLSLTFDKSDMLNEVASIVKDFIIEKSESLQEIVPNEDTRKLLLSLAKFVARGRALVIRDGFTRAVSQVHNPETPIRIYTTLLSLYKSLFALHGNQNRTIKIIKNVCNSSILKSRYDVLRIFQDHSGPIPTNHFFTKIPLDDTIIRRTLEDLSCQKILDQSKSSKQNLNEYSINPDFKELFDSARF